MKTTTRFGIYLTVVSLLLLTGHVFADHEVIPSQEGGIPCVTVTFEGADHFVPIHPEDSGLIAGTGIRFPEGPWFTVTSGPFANNPSGTTVVLGTGSTGEVTFDQPVSRVSFAFSTAATITLEAFDSSGHIVASDSNPGSGFPLTRVGRVRHRCGCTDHCSHCSYIRQFSDGNR